MATTEITGFGARIEESGGRFTLFSSCAQAVELCLFDADHQQTARHRLEETSYGAWQLHVPGIEAGQRYGYRVHGPYEPTSGLWCNPAKLLIDPYARELDGGFRWHPAVFGYDQQDPAGRPNTLDSAPFVPKSVVMSERPRRGTGRPRIPAAETLLYELNLRGFTMRHPDLTDAEKGTCLGLRSETILPYLKALGITSIELLPVFAFLDEEHLHRLGLRNYWGYNTINFFAPSRRYLGDEGPAGFQAMVDAIHDAGMEVILDVAYNHTAEGDQLGPTVSFRGIDNLAYYRTHADNPGSYVNDTGCGNTVNVDHPRVQEMIVASLHYWVDRMGVDGFRFDLAATLSRTREGFTPNHPLIRKIVSDPVMKRVKLIAEPWDIGPGGYQLGGFPASFAEWNDRFRDTVRRFWRGDAGLAADLARRLHGSADLFEPAGRRPQASVNYVTSHDGFTLADLVSYEQRHNHANGENNRDGHPHNFSRNFGIEGPTSNPEINTLRRRQRLNLLATLMFSQGIPMLLAGDEFGHSQKGNNNAYAQDNEIGWLDWSGLERDRPFHEKVRALIALRRRLPVLRQHKYLHGESVGTRRNVEWLRPDGQPLSDRAWGETRAFCLMYWSVGSDRHELEPVAILINGSDHPVDFQLPALDTPWRCAFSSADGLATPVPSGCWALAMLSIACLIPDRGHGTMGSS